MIYATVKWYALTVGAWKRYRWWKSLTRSQELHALLRQVWSYERLIWLRERSPLQDLREGVR